MQNATESLASSTRQRDTSGLLARAIRFLFGREEVRRPSRTDWASMRPIDFEGEDTSLTQDQLELMR